MRGHIIAHEKVRTHSRTLARLVAIARDEAAARGPEVRLAVHYFGNLEAAQEIVQELAGASIFEVLAVPVPAVLGAHTGAGVLAVAITGGIEPPAPGPARPDHRPKAESKQKPEPRVRPEPKPRRRTGTPVSDARSAATPAEAGTRPGDTAHQ